MKIVDIELRLLRTNPVQPLGRHNTEASIRGIVEDMREHRHGVLRPLSVVPDGSHYIIADGHRRAAAATAMGLVKVPCVVEPRGTDPVAQWIALNGSTASIRGKHWFEGWAKLGSEHARDAFLKGMPLSTRGAVMGMVSVFGKERAVELALTGRVVPSNAAAIHAIYAALLDRLGRVPVSKRELGEWCISFGVDVKSFVRTSPAKSKMSKLASRIREGKPFPRGEW